MEKLVRFNKKKIMWAYTQGFKFPAEETHLYQLENKPILNLQTLFVLIKDFNSMLINFYILATKILIIPYVGGCKIFLFFTNEVQSALY